MTFPAAMFPIVKSLKTTTGRLAQVAIQEHSAAGPTELVSGSFDPSDLNHSRIIKDSICLCGVVIHLLWHDNGSSET